MYNGYCVVPNRYLNIKNNEQNINGLFLHRMMVYAFGDRNGKKYVKGMVIDHVDMDHKNNAVDNLELVTEVVNLARAVVICPTPLCCSRLEQYLKDVAGYSKLGLAMMLGEIEKDLGFSILPYLSAVDGLTPIIEADIKESEEK